MAQRLSYILMDQGLQNESRGILSEVLEKMELVYVQMHHAEVMGIDWDKMPQPSKARSLETLDQLLLAASEADVNMDSDWLCLLVKRLSQELARADRLLRGTREYSPMADRNGN